MATITQQQLTAKFTRANTGLYTAQHQRLKIINPDYIDTHVSFAPTRPKKDGDNWTFGGFHVSWYYNQTKIGHLSWTEGNVSWNVDLVNTWMNGIYKNSSTNAAYKLYGLRAVASANRIADNFRTYMATPNHKNFALTQAQHANIL